MLLEQSKTRWAVIVLGLLALGGTHWFAYQQGVRSENRRVGLYLVTMDDDCGAAVFESQLLYLRLLSRHPDDVSHDERLSACRHAKNQADEVERSQVRKNREIGDDGKAERWQKKIAEARDLAARLTPVDP